MTFYQAITYSFVKGLLLLLIITTTNCYAKTDADAENKTYKIGVLAYKGKASAIKRWYAHQTYLNEKLAPLKFETNPLGFADNEMTDEVIKRNVDFMISNSGHYIELELGGHVPRLATRRMKSSSGTLDTFGGVAFTLPHRTDINDYTDLIGKNVLIPSTSSLGGWQVHLGEALSQGVDLRIDSNILQLKDHSKVVEAIIAGEADVGLVRSDLVEEMVLDGLIEIDQIKVINKQTFAGYPYLLSTRLYPEWPFAIVTGTSKDVATEVVAVLLGIHEDDQVAIDAGIYGWTVPGHYSPIRELFSRAGLGPYVVEPVTLMEIFAKYKYQLLMILLLFIMVLIINYKSKVANQILSIEIVERKQVELKLLRNQQRFEQAQQITKMGIWEFDIKKNKLTWSKVVFNIFELDESSFTPSYHTFFEMNHPDVRNAVKDAYETSLIDQFPYDIVHRLRMNDGRVKYVNECCNSDFDSDGSALFSVGTILDITERIETKMQLETLNEVRKASLNIMHDVEDARKEAENASSVKSTFLANMSHEIRTPLNAVAGMNYLLKQTDLNEQQLNYVDTIQLSMGHVISIVNDLLDISKIEAGKLKLEAIPFRLNEVIDKLRIIVQPEANKKNLKLSIDIADGLPNHLIGDPVRLGQILINLASNAIKFCEEGKVSVSVLQIKRDESSIKIKFKVVDTGIGLSKAQITSIFEAFQQADISTTRQFGGTGLGLTISQYLVDEMGGEIKVKSKVGEGSEFRFTIKLKVQEK